MNFGVRPPLSNRVACHATNTQQDFSLCLPAVAVAPGAPFCAPAEWRGCVEFGLVAVPFLGLTFAILETALVFFAGQTLETAVADSARLIARPARRKRRVDQGRLQDRSVQSHLRIVRLRERHLR